MNNEAFEETAKTVGKGIDLAKEVGGFIAPLIKGTLEQGIGIFEDKLNYARWERQIRFIKRANRIMEEYGIDEIQNPIPLKFAVPLLQGVSLEDDDDLQDLWTNLLINAVSNKNIELKRVYIDILERISPLEAKILEKIYSLPFDLYQHKPLSTYCLPDNIDVQSEDRQEVPPLDNADIELALINLARIGCISSVKTFGGGEIFSQINMTLLGNKFHEACTL